jgi:hypothetical protein
MFLVLVVVLEIPENDDEEEGQNSIFRQSLKANLSGKPFSLPRRTIA